MTEAFAAAVTVTVPILALAAGAEARAIRERVRKPDEAWEKAFAEYQKEHEFDPSKPHADALEYFIGMPGLSKAFMLSRVSALAGAIAWLVVFVLLGIDEIVSLVWLGDGARGADTGLATFSVWTIGLALGSLIVAPAIYLMIPLLVPLDLVPHGLKKAVGPKLVSVHGRDLLRHMAREFETAVEHVAEEAQHAKEARPGGEGQPAGVDQPELARGAVGAVVLAGAGPVAAFEALAVAQRLAIRRPVGAVRPGRDRGGRGGVRVAGGGQEALEPGRPGKLDPRRLQLRAAAAAGRRGDLQPGQLLGPQVHRRHPVDGLDRFHHRRA
jgi:hypothetical protein